MRRVQVSNNSSSFSRTWFGLLLAGILFHGSEGFASFASTKPTSRVHVPYSTALSGERENGASSNTGAWDRRAVLSSSAALLSAAGTFPGAATAGAQKTTTTDISASWSAVDGLNSLDSNAKFVSFDNEAYKAMKDDPTRTPLFERAIKRRLGNDPKSMTVLDLGTGPFALFAILAAQAGAGQVYAIEANPVAAQSARETIQKAGFSSQQITVLEGFSSQITLPQKADFCIAEIVGSIASEEGAYATVRDAHSRFLKDPTAASSWIPSRIQTYTAPASYTLHNVLGPPEFDWAKLGGEPVRFNCRDQGLQLLADPVLVEDISFADILGPQNKNGRQQLSFVVDPERLEDNADAFFNEFRRVQTQDAAVRAAQTARSFTGMALWPRLVLDDQTVVDSRKYQTGDHQRSHWQTVLPIMAARPVPVQGGDSIRITTDFTLPSDIATPPRYAMKGQVQRG